MPDKHRWLADLEDMIAQAEQIRAELVCEPADHDPRPPAAERAARRWKRAADTPMSASLPCFLRDRVRTWVSRAHRSVE